MRVRSPEMDFSTVRPHWAPNREFAQYYNAFSTVPAHIEPYLVKVMTKAKKAVDPAERALLQEMEIFIKQEVQHCKQHLAFNRMLAAHYPGMTAIEADYQADYDRFLKTKSLRFNVAYSEGFEAMGSAAAQIFFEDLGPFLRGADPKVLELWRWHLAEEFEHREVCHKVYSTLYGHGPLAWLYRVYGFVTAARHIGAHTERLARHLVAQDRSAMAPAEQAASRRLEAAFLRANRRISLKRLRQVFSPFYDPARRKASPGMAEVLARY